MGNTETVDIVRYSKGQLPDKYKNFVRANWMRSYRFGNEYIKLSDSDAYYFSYTNYIERLLLNPQTVIRIAVLNSDPDVALGFSVMIDKVLYYVFMNKDFRRLGIGKLLVPTKVDWITHITKKGLLLWPTKLPKAKFNPFM